MEKRRKRRGEPVATSRSGSLARARVEVRKFVPVSRDLVAELIQDRRAEAADEDGAPILRALRGSLKRADIGGYGKYLAEKYRGSTKGS